MRTTFSCPACGKSFSADSRMEGKRARCSSCKTIMLVPEPGGDAIQEMVFAAAGERRSKTMSGRARPALGWVTNAAAIFGGILGAISWRIWAAAGGLALVTMLIVAVHSSVGTASKTKTSKSTDIVQATSPAVFPERPAMTAVEQGVEFCEIRLGGEGPGQNMKLWLYLPSGKHAVRSLPCVLIAPAGSPLIIGIGLADGDRPEHLPYVREGFAVMAYELDGAVPDLENASNDQFFRACRQFLAAEGGQANARSALAYLAANVPEVDPNRLFCIGHSSAGTVALQLASSESSFRGCIAFAPATDIHRHLADHFEEFCSEVPAIRDYVSRKSPINMSAPNCPVFLFHAADDENVPLTDSQQYLNKHTGLVDLTVVPTGGHFDPMINQGIPAGIAWMRAHGAFKQ